MEFQSREVTIMTEFTEGQAQSSQTKADVEKPGLLNSRLSSSMKSIQTKNGTALRSGILFTVFMLIFLLSISGIMEKVAGNIIMVERVSELNQQFLKTSLGSAVGHFAVLSLAKGSVSVLANIEVDVKPVGVGVGIPFGKVFSGVSETLDALWRFFGYSMVSITAQMAILKFFNLVTFKIVIPIGALFIAISAIGFQALRRFGAALIIIGFILYVLMPYTVYVGKFLFEQSNMESSVILSEDLGVLKEKVSDIDLLAQKNLTSSGIKETLDDISISISQSVDVVLSATVKYFSNLIIMFIITPLFFYGFIYISTKKLLAFVGMEETAASVDQGVANAWGKMWKRKARLRPENIPAEPVKNSRGGQE
jgi:hypothetical protein